LPTQKQHIILDKHEEEGLQYSLLQKTNIHHTFCIKIAAPEAKPWGILEENPYTFCLWIAAPETKLQGILEGISITLHIDRSLLQKPVSRELSSDL
jgi:hypothetical protein